MTIERYAGQISFICDDCEYESPSHDADDFDLLRIENRAAGWKTVKEDGQWCHYCPDCNL